MFVAKFEKKTLSLDEYSNATHHGKITCLDPQCEVPVIFVEKNSRARAYFRAKNKHVQNCEHEAAITTIARIANGAIENGERIDDKRRIFEIVIDPSETQYEGEGNDENFAKLPDKLKCVVFRPRGKHVARTRLSALLAILVQNKALDNILIRLPKEGIRPAEEIIFSEKNENYGLYWGKIWSDGSDAYKWRNIYINDYNFPQLYAVVNRDNFEKLKVQCGLPPTVPLCGAYLVVIGKPNENGGIVAPLSHIHVAYFPY